MGLNIFQTAASKTYGHGIFAHIARIKDDVELIKAIDATDDMAFQNMIEALGQPDCDTREKAVIVLKNTVAEARRIIDPTYENPSGHYQHELVAQHAPSM